jgi:8-oxo-dGTP pyrophosphatase MutT (NUDIX family)
MEWKTIASEYLFRENWFTVRKDTCLRPDGKRVEPYYVYEFPTWVIALALTREGKVVMERQYRHAIGLTAYELPGGCVDPEDPDLVSAVSRELREETGYSFDSFEYLGKTSSNPSTHNNWMHFFLARGGVRVTDPMLDENEDIEVQLMSLNEVKELVDRGEMIQSMHVTACYHAFRKLGLLVS